MGSTSVLFKKKNFKLSRFLEKTLNPKNYTFSTYILILTNFIVLLIAILEKWSFGYLLFAYLGQNFIIGFFTFFKIRNAKKYIPLNMYKTSQINNKHVTKKRKGGPKSASSFFLLHYFGFNFMYLFFLLFFVGLEVSSKIGYITINPLTIIPFFNMTPLYLSWGIFFVNHLISFIIYSQKEKNNKKDLGRLMIQPYPRIIPMHLLFLIGGELISFMFLKTVIDVMMHNFEHQQTL